MSDGPMLADARRQREILIDVVCHARNSEYEDAIRHELERLRSWPPVLGVYLVSARCWGSWGFHVQPHNSQVVALKREHRRRTGQSIRKVLWLDMERHLGDHAAITAAEAIGEDDPDRWPLA